jgi:hypothetical protein
MHLSPQPPPCPPQHLVLVRHGESEYNRADAESRSTRDPALFDARLTTKGKKQAGELRDRLAAVLAKYNAGKGGKVVRWWCARWCAGVGGALVWVAHSVGAAGWCAGVA